MALKVINWPRCPLLLVVDFAAKRITRRQGRVLVGVWEWEEDGLMTAVLLEEVRARGYGEQKDFDFQPGGVA